MKLGIFIARDSEVSKSPLLRLSLTLPDGSKLESGPQGRMAEAFFAIQVQLPRLQYFKNCYGCASSVFSPLQRRPYGALACFKSQPKHVVFRTTAEVVRNWSKVDSIVQELHVCPSFRRRTSKRYGVSSLRSGNLNFLLSLCRPEPAPLDIGPGKI